MSRKWLLASRGVRRQGDREREAGLEPEDEAARWLAEQEPEPPLTTSKSARKSKELHRWRQRQQKEGR